MANSDLCDNVLGRLKRVRPAGEGKWTALCPAHDDHTPSLSIALADDGKVLLNCHAGCSVETVCAAINLRIADLFPEGPEPPCQGALRSRRAQVYADLETAAASLAAQVEGAPAGTWVYRDLAGAAAFAVCRFNLEAGRKTYRPVHQESGGWVLGDPVGPLPLYGLEALDGASRVYVVEGEKCTDAARTTGLTAVTSAHGAQAPEKSDWSPLAGKEVVLLPDNDQAGGQYAAKVTDILLHLKPPASVRTVHLPGLPDGGDIVDWLDTRDAAEPETLRNEIDRMAAAALPAAAPQATEDGQADAADDMARSSDYRTDVGNAARFVLREGDNFLYCAPWGKWLCWDGARWKADDRERVGHRAKRVALSLYDEARRAQSDQRGATEWALRSQSNSRVKAMVELAKCELTVTPEQLDADPMVLNVLNGVIDLRTGAMVPHQRASLHTKVAPVMFDPRATCPLWNAFLERIMGGNGELIAFAQRIAGLCLTGDASEQVLFIFHGGGSNGKSVLLDTLAGLLGDYAGEAPPDLLVARQHDQHPTELADLCGRRMIIASETEEGARLRIQLIKRLTGNARIKARFIRQDYFEFARTHKLILVTNNCPSVREATNAVWRRLLLVPFEVTIPIEEQDRTLLRKLKSEWAGILNWAIAGCLAWQGEGLKPPAAVNDATAEYRTEQDALSDFLSECCILHDGAVVSRAAVSAAYGNWAEQRKDRFPLSPTALYARLRALPGVKESSKRINGAPYRGFAGIGLLDKHREGGSP